jgi:hypothetical protein
VCREPLAQADEGHPSVAPWALRGSTDRVLPPPVRRGRLVGWGVPGLITDVPELVAEELSDMGVAA